MSRVRQDDVTAPRWAQALLARLAPPDRIDEVLGDLEEVHRDRARRRGRVVATVFTAFDTLDVAVALLREPRELVCDQRPPRAIEPFFRDARFAVRSLRRAPSFALIAIVSLGVAIGANTVIFGLIRALLLERLEIPSAAQLVALWPETAGGPALVDYASLQHLVLPSGMSRVEGLRSEQVAVTWRDQHEYAWVDLVPGDFFDFVKVGAAVGRPLSPADEQSASPVVVLSWQYWQTVFGGDSSIVGRTIGLNGAPFTVIGIMPRSYRGVFFGRTFTLAVPISAAATASLPDVRAVPLLALLARLDHIGDVPRVGPSLDLAFQRCCASPQFGAGRVQPSHPRSVSGAGVPSLHVRIEDASRGIRWGVDLRGEYRRTLAALMGGVALLLLIACTNVGTLTLTRAAARQREFAVRMSLGASRARLVGQQFSESLVIAVCSAALGIALAYLTTYALSQNLPAHAASLSDLVTLRPSAALLLFTICTTAGCTLLVGVFAAVRASRVQFISAAHGSATASRRRVIDQSLVIAQFAFGLVLVSVAILYVATLHKLKGNSGGYRTTGVTLASVTTRNTHYDDRGLLPEVMPLLARIQRLPGVTSVAMASAAPVLQNDGLTITRIHRLGVDRLPEDLAKVDVNLVSPGFFAATGIGLREGRDISSGDVVGSDGVTIVSAALARHYFPDRDPVGQILVLDRADPAPQLRIIGVANDARYEDLGAPAPEVFYVPLSQSDRLGWKHGPRDFAVIVRSSGDTAPPVVAVRGAIADVAQGIRIRVCATIDHVLDDVLSRERLAAIVSTLFGALALALAAVGLYGVVAYGVVMRTREIGIRLALGAERRSTLELVLRQAMRMTTIGIAVGVPVALAASRAVQTQLFGVEAGDPRVFLGAVAALLVVGLIASVVPAWRASRVDPMEALRSE